VKFFKTLLQIFTEDKMQNSKNILMKLASGDQ